MQNVDNEGPYYAMVCRLQEYQAVDPVPNNNTIKKLPCVAAELYCHMNHSSDLSRDSATDLSV